MDSTLRLFLELERHLNDTFNFSALRWILDVVEGTLPQDFQVTVPIDKRENTITGIVVVSLLHSQGRPLKALSDSSSELRIMQQCPFIRIASASPTV